LKPQNVLLDRAYKAKLCDFGLSSSSKEGAGTLAYMAPELLENAPYNIKVDVYAFGILLNEMLSKQPPFGAVGLARLHARVLAGERPIVSPNVPEDLKEIIGGCWAASASARPNMEYIQERLCRVVDRLKGPPS
jgi:serine/threonine-protein kinase CTR1